jgi:hypothetical protein
MAVTENHVDIDRPAAQVFDYCVDMRNELAWNPNAQSMEKTTPGPIGVGTKFLAKWKQSKVIAVECTAFDRPHSWAYHNGGPLEVLFQARVELHGKGASTLHVRFEAIPHGGLRLVFPILWRILRRQEHANMARLKQVLEAR